MRRIKERKSITVHYEFQLHNEVQLLKNGWYIENIWYLQTEKGVKLPVATLARDIVKHNRINKFFRKVFKIKS